MAGTAAQLVDVTAHRAAPVRVIKTSVAGKRDLAGVGRGSRIGLIGAGFSAVAGFALVLVVTAFDAWLAEAASMAAWSGVAGMKDHASQELARNSKPRQDRERGPTLC